MSSNLLRRIAVAVVGIPAALGLVYLGGWPLAGAVSVLAGVGAWELYRLAASSGLQPLVWLGVIISAGIPLAAMSVLSGGLGSRWVVLGAAGGLMLVMAAVMRLRSPTQRPLAAIAVTVFGAAFAGGLPSFALYLRHADPSWASWTGTAVVFLPIVLVWIGDICAMAAGAAFGGRRLAPVLSPRKTWAGAVASIASAVVVAPLYGTVALQPAGVTVSVGGLVVLGALISVAGQAGDVAESLLKREAGVKDSGSFFSGHGGVLDRLDALYWALPTAVMLFSAVDVV
ncbi:MAG TPA: phosphatidate cytidylyltransferase [Gemmatimonadales bacterium]